MNHNKLILEHERELVHTSIHNRLVRGINIGADVVEKDLTHEEFLDEWERELAVLHIINKRGYDKLRASLVEKYGEEKVQIKERQLRCQWEKEIYAGH